MTELEVNNAWYGIEKTLRNLDLLEGKLSIDIGHLLIYKAAFAGDYLPWESNFDVTDEESDNDQLDAIKEMKDFEVNVNFATMILRIFSDS